MVDSVKKSPTLTLSKKSNLDAVKRVQPSHESRSTRVSLLFSLNH